MSESLNVKLSQLKPKNNQDRKDWNSPSAREHIEQLKRSIGLELPNGQTYGIREPIVVKRGQDMARSLFFVVNLAGEQEGKLRKRKVLNSNVRLKLFLTKTKF